ncbi:hypothetical protein Emed_005476 [Eimeria media]
MAAADASVAAIVGASAAAARGVGVADAVSKWNKKPPWQTAVLTALLHSCCSAGGASRLLKARSSLLRRGAPHRVWVKTWGPPQTFLERAPAYNPDELGPSGKHRATLREHSYCSSSIDSSNCVGCNCSTSSNSRSSSNSSLIRTDLDISEGQQAR